MRTSVNKIEIDTIEFQKTSSEKEPKLQEQENSVGETKRKRRQIGEKRIASKKDENTRDKEVSERERSKKVIRLIMMICKIFGDLSDCMIRLGIGGNAFCDERTLREIYRSRQRLEDLT